MHLTKNIVTCIKFTFVIFATTGFQYFNQEVETLLINDIFNQVSAKKADVKLKIVFGIIEKYELNLHSKAIKKLTVSRILSKADKITLLKIKLDFIINDEYTGKKRDIKDININDLNSSLLLIVITVSFFESFIN
jgi:hypothetical protein